MRIGKRAVLLRAKNYTPEGKECGWDECLHWVRIQSLGLPAGSEMAYDRKKRLLEQVKELERQAAVLRSEVVALTVEVDASDRGSGETT